MTENEAIKELSNELRIITSIIAFCRDFEKESDMALAYRLKRQEAMKIAISALKEIQEYQNIGTADECKAAVEKQRPMKPLEGLDLYGNDYKICRQCSAIVEDGEWRANFCPDCGNAIDWSKEECDL
ncbi:MAG TPA: hypothetical protein H9742_14405 [Candidatus Acetatifactor stercoripullorum]|uniref:Uncharacterized protein n=1 Tax=Candidatus Acetatifactor stercoripullorum TaxID=2838414 RepID=A0A9D1R846_9FIRM|nr:hypothetical protein [Candidatus Acetatifactor stercoripullorum]